MSLTRRLCLLIALALALGACGDDSNPGGRSAVGGGGGSSSSTTSSGSAGASGGGGDGGGAGGDGGQGGGPICEPAEGEIPALELVPFATDLTLPIVMVVDPTAPDRYLVGEREGRIRVVEGGVTLPDPFLDVSADVRCCTEDRGFLGIALHPQYADNGLFYVHYTRLGTPFDSTTVIAEYQVSDDPLLADPTPIRELLVLAQDDVWHYGGALLFGPDGLLYYPRGDGGGQGDPEGDAQDPLSQLGKVLRLDVDTYPEPPAGNMPGADPFVWSIGLRNPWRSSFDSCTGDLYLGDVGQGDVEEVSVKLATDGHLDFGWNTYEGSACFAPPCDPGGKTMPLVEHLHTDGWCAIIGGYVYRGDAIPALRGRYFYGDHCTRNILSFQLDAGVATDPLSHTIDLETVDVITDAGFGSFGQDAAGELYVLDMDAGVIYRIEAEQ